MGGSSIMATAGKVAPTPKDKFVNGTAYDKLDVVEYNGTLYIAKKASAGVLPTDTEYWMLAVDLTGKLDTTGDTENNTVTFESGDEADPTAWKNVNVLSSKEKHSSLLKKISTMFSNVRYLYKLLGTTDISALGTVTQALANLDGNVGDIKGIISSLADCSAATVAGYAADALAVKELNSNLTLYCLTLHFNNIDVNIKSENGLYYSNPITIKQLDDTNYINGYISEWSGASSMFGICHKVNTNTIFIASQELQTITRLEIQLILSKKIYSLV